MRTIADINAKIVAGSVTVLTVCELKELVAEVGVRAAFERVDAIATGTFEPMEASGAILNIGHSDPPIKIHRAWLNEVPAYAGFGAVDLYVGAAQPSDKADGAYGGGHAIADLIAGKSVHLHAVGQVTDCYPRAEIDTMLSKERLNQFYLFNPRNAYQNFIVGVNGGDRPLYTYLGPLQPRLGNAVYSNPGALSPLLNDPELKAIGIGTRIFLGGAQGYIAWEGTQHFPGQKRLPNLTPIGPSATLALIGDAKQMQSQWVRGCYFKGYGPSLMLGVGIPIPVLNEEVVERAAVSDAELVAPVVDFAIPRRVRPTFGLVSYAQLKSGQIQLNGQLVRVAPLASLRLSLAVAEALKLQIQSGEFLLSEPVAALPSDREFLPLQE
ncbi:homocysteine biosynthesis protein [Synechococcus sp. PCC 7336]|uniref:homocysteine biosynthesis protein n=1 Tax=Synechococcus sp. PCC 7336 TaxID=195250 RepID=UPI00047690F4|nr:homocysteine biosynthesis protein [Synechococcus sp. PCC 7336]